MEITVRRNGPYFVQGPIVLKDHDGNVIQTQEVFKLCRCGHSKTKPFCDGTHKVIGFVGTSPPPETPATPAGPPPPPPAAAPGPPL